MEHRPGRPSRKKGMCAEAMHASMSSSFVSKVSRYFSRSLGTCSIHGIGHCTSVAEPSSWDCS